MNKLIKFLRSTDDYPTFSCLETLEGPWNLVERRRPLVPQPLTLIAVHTRAPSLGEGKPRSYKSRRFSQGWDPTRYLLLGRT